MVFTTKLVTIADIKRFAKICNDIPDEVYVRVGQYSVDGKSVMGLFSLDLTKTLYVTVPTQYVDMFDSMVEEFVE